MLIEAEVITYGDQTSGTNHMTTGSEHELNASAKIQVFIARSTDKSVSPYRVSIIPESTHVIVNEASPRFLSRINTDTTMNRSGKVKSIVVTCVTNEQQKTRSS